MTTYKEFLHLGVNPSREHPVMLAIDVDGESWAAIPEDQAVRFAIGLSGILSEHFELSTEGDGGTNDAVAYALAGAPAMFGAAEPEVNGPRLDRALGAIEKARNEGVIPEGVTVRLMYAMR